MGICETREIDGGKVLVITLPDEGSPLPGQTAVPEIDRALAEGAAGVVVDTSPRDLVTSAAIGFVILVRQHLAPEIRMAVLGGRQLGRLVEMMNLQGVLPTFETMGDAQAHVVG